ncbi:MAG: hypothetical protein JWQ81_142 [Amycolatopsis sp.]|nr:hypothetical protein [Amycolatopsis sp.]
MKTVSYRESWRKGLSGLRRRQGSTRRGRTWRGLAKPNLGGRRFRCPRDGNSPSTCEPPQRRWPPVGGEALALGRRPCRPSRQRRALRRVAVPGEERWSNPPRGSSLRGRRRYLSPSCRGCRSRPPDVRRAEQDEAAVLGAVDREILEDQIVCAAGVGAEAVGPGRSDADEPLVGVVAQCDKAFAAAGPCDDRAAAVAVEGDVLSRGPIVLDGESAGVGPGRDVDVVAGPSRVGGTSAGQARSLA